MSATDELIKRIDSDDDDIRGEVVSLPTGGPLVKGGLYPHQAECLTQLNAQPINGIVHLPTGAGKTRLAMAFIADTLKSDPEHLFLWVSYPTQLIKQSMARLIEYTPQLPGGTKTLWYHHRNNQAQDFKPLSVIFMLLGQLTEILDSGGREANSLRRALAGGGRRKGRRVTLIFDECHLMGAEGLQWGFKTFYDAVPEAKTKLRLVGLSATPIPNAQYGRDYFKRSFFPLDERYPSTVRKDSESWGVHLFHQVTPESLRQAKVLCPVRDDYQSRFQIPKRLFQRVTGNRLQDPGKNTKNHKKFSMQFNRTVMADERIVRHLATRLAEHLKVLGKTIVFMPDIDSAERFTELLAADPRVGPDKVSVVHSKRDAGSDADSNAEAIRRFKDRGSKACVLVNVGLLTTGFDDPLIQTVLLGRLTLSPNLFWQMIGRGTRGPKSGGTDMCNVIDPVRLTEMYPIVGTYQPTIDNDMHFGATKSGGLEKKSADIDDDEDWDEHKIRAFVLEYLTDLTEVSRRDVLDCLTAVQLRSMWTQLSGETVSSSAGVRKAKLLKDLSKYSWADLLAYEVADDDIIIALTDFILYEADPGEDELEDLRSRIPGEVRAQGYNKEDALDWLKKDQLWQLLEWLSNGSTTLGRRANKILIVDQLNRYRWDLILADDDVVWDLAAELGLLDDDDPEGQPDMSVDVERAVDLQKAYRDLGYSKADALNEMTRDTLYTLLLELTAGASPLNSKARKAELVEAVCRFTWSDILEDHDAAEFLQIEIEVIQGDPETLTPSDDPIQEFDEIRLSLPTLVRNAGLNKEEALDILTKTMLVTLLDRLTEHDSPLYRSDYKYEFVDQLKRFRWDQLIGTGAMDDEMVKRIAQTICD